MAKRSCERCVENKTEMVDHASCEYLPGDRDRSTFEPTAAICSHFEEDKVCGVRCPENAGIQHRTCNRVKGHKGPHQARNDLYNSDEYVMVEWGKVEKTTPKKKEKWSNNAKS